MTDLVYRFTDVCIMAKFGEYEKNRYTLKQWI